MVRSCVRRGNPVSRCSGGDQQQDAHGEARERSVAAKGKVPRIQGLRAICVPQFLGFNTSAMSA